MLKSHSHLSDDQLLEACLEGVEVRDDDRCALCDDRRARLAALLAEVHEAAVCEADAVFPAERLTRQQARVLQRIEQDGRPGRLIAFPGHAHEAPAGGSRPGTRWIAAAAAAGLVIGLVAGHMARDIPGRALPPERVTVGPTDALQPALRAVATSFSEDDFLGEVEMAADSPGGTDLRAMHDLTPRAWEVK